MIQIKAQHRRIVDTESEKGDCIMLRLASLLYSIIGTSLAGAFIIAALVAGFDTGRGIILAAAFGAVLGLPAAWMVARAITARTPVRVRA